MRPVVSVEGLGKRFVIRQRGDDSARSALESLLRAPFRGRYAGRAPEEPPTKQRDGVLWALDDVSFEVREGEVVALMGRNGAGKSVLLKILARVIRPTRGRAEIRGKVAGLLELGTGFRPELTGRENIYLNGAILGLRRNDVRRQLDRIVAFSETGEFLDEPVKHYSNGMRVRLAFAAAVHLDREVFLLDEILAVGDREFQQRCIEKLGELAREGRTILLVSHSNNMVQRLCTRAILLERGRLIASGRPSDIVSLYTGMGRESGEPRVVAAAEA